MDACGTPAGEAGWEKSLAGTDRVAPCHLEVVGKDEKDSKLIPFSAVQKVRGASLGKLAKRWGRLACLGKF